jgi:hypothetical protein
VRVGGGNLNDKTKEYIFNSTKLKIRLLREGKELTTIRNTLQNELAQRG